MGDKEAKKAAKKRERLYQHYDEFKILTDDASVMPDEDELREIQSIEVPEVEIDEKSINTELHSLESDLNQLNLMLSKMRLKLEEPTAIEKAPGIAEGQGEELEAKVEEQVTKLSNGQALLQADLETAIEDVEQIEEAKVVPVSLFEREEATLTLSKKATDPKITQYEEVLTKLMTSLELDSWQDARANTEEVIDYFLIQKNTFHSSISFEMYKFAIAVQTYVDAQITLEHDDFPEKYIYANELLSNSILLNTELQKKKTESEVLEQSMKKLEKKLNRELRFVNTKLD